MDKLPENPSPVELEHCSPPQEKNTIELKAHFIGEAPAIATGYNLLGRITHYAIPYTENALLFEIEATNTGTQLATLPIDKIRLHSNKLEYFPIRLQHYHHVWPAVAQLSEEQMRDRSRALGAVIRSYFNGKDILPGQTRKGIVPFRKGFNTQNFQLELPLDILAEEKQRFCPTPSKESN